MQETLVQFMGQEDPLEKGYTTHSNILGFPLWLSWLRICLQCERLGLIPGLGRSLEKGQATHSSTFFALYPACLLLLFFFFIYFY